MLNEEQFFRQLASHMVAAVRIQVSSRTEQICKCWQKDMLATDVESAD